MENITLTGNTLNESIAALLVQENLGVLRHVSLLDGGGSSSHDNYLIEADIGKYVLRIVKESGALNHTHLESEYKILQLLKEYDVAPRAIAFDTDIFGKPVLLESYVEGDVASSRVFPEEYISVCLELLGKVSSVSITENDFSFVFRYPSYEVSFPVWKERIDVVRNVSPVLAERLDSIAETAKIILIKNDALLKDIPQTFIYNDVHPGNIIFQTSEDKAVFIDWQKVSLGDPMFMVVLFGERFASIFGMEKEKFRNKVQELWKQRVTIPHMDTLYAARAYERAVSDLVWIAWATAKRGEKMSEHDEVLQMHMANVSYWESVNN
ncbi:MAG: aminoglycoside phosphotransferase family protein [Candidatus Pacebacteria bacterium]|nr:aminoglycoside phosphotransferase family protein [Candidatus Paceibacterota bacterium]